MNLTPYEFSKILFYKFYRNHLAIFDWRDYKNDFTNDSQVLVDEFYQFKMNVNEKLIVLSTMNKDELVGEFDELEALKTKWNKFVNEFARIEQIFTEKYHIDIADLDELLSDKDKLRTFLAEYHAFENMESVYDSLLGIEVELVKYINLCQALSQKQFA